MKNKISRDDDSAEMLDLIFNTSFYDLGTDIGSRFVKNVYTASIFLPKSNTVASVTASINSQLTAEIQKFEQETREYLEKLGK